MFSCVREHGMKSSNHLQQSLQFMILPFSEANEKRWLWCHVALELVHIWTRLSTSGFSSAPQTPYHEMPHLSHILQLHERHCWYPQIPDHPDFYSFTSPLGVCVFFRPRTSITWGTTSAPTAHALDRLIFFHLCFGNPTYTCRVEIGFLRLYAAEAAKLEIQSVTVYQTLRTYVHNKKGKKHTFS